MRTAASPSQGGSLGDLTTLAVFVCVGMLIFMATASPVSTTRGARYLRQRRQAGPPAAMDDHGALLFGVALNGFSAVPDEGTRYALLYGTDRSSGDSHCGCGT
jgi:hypothetical protein